MEQEGNDEYPQLLYMSATEHRTSRIEKKSDLAMRVHAHRCGIPYHEKMAPALKRLGLYQMSQLEDCQIDKALISALVERWRPETNTFHLRLGEMTVTLEDVSILWGLSLRGKPISGVSDDEWSRLVQDCLGIEPAYPDGPPQTGPWKFKQKNKGRENETVVYSGYHLRLAWLRQNFTSLADDADDHTLAYYTRAYCLDLLGSVMFPDTSADGVPVMFLQFLENLDDPPEYSWGCAVLAYLYRELSRGCRAGTDSIAGPMLLLQMWSWTRLTVGRPQLLYEHAGWGGDDPDTRNAYGVKWTTRHRFPDNPHNCGTSQYRDQLERIPDHGVRWRPYGEYYGMLPTRAHRDYDLWMVRMPLVFFWIVEFHYPDRVMRQYHLYQSVPPPAPDSWDILEQLRSSRHVSGRGACAGVDWMRVHKRYIDAQPITIPENRVWNDSVLRAYMHWFHTRGMDTTWPRYTDAEEVSRPLPPVDGEVGGLAYQPHGHKYRRVVSRTIRHTALGISWLLTQGKKAVGKLTLQMCRGTMADLEQSHIYEGMLTRAGIPTNVDEIPVDDDVPTSIPSMPPEPEYQHGYEFFDLNPTGETDWGSIMGMMAGGTEWAGGTSTSQAGYEYFSGMAGPSTSQPAPHSDIAHPVTSTAEPSLSPTIQAAPSTEEQEEQDGRPVRQRREPERWVPSGRRSRRR